VTTKPSIAIICVSIHHGNTHKLATTLTSELGADLFSVDEAKNIRLASYQLVGLGSGIYFGRHHGSLRELVDSWQAPPRRVFLFSTAGLPFLRWCQHSSLRRRLVRKGCQVVSEFCCRGWDTVGPLWLMGGINRKHPNSRDLDRAIEFAQGLIP
jgi:flavodoxin